MLNDVFVLDAIAHAYNFRQSNRIGQPYADGIATGVYQMHTQFAPPGRPDLVLDQYTFDNDICDPDLTGDVIFGESHTDATIYHELPLYGYFRMAVRRSGSARRCGSAGRAVCSSMAASRRTSRMRSTGSTRLVRSTRFRASSSTRTT